MDGLPEGYPRGCAERFRPVRLLAQGGFGAVWLAVQVALDRPAAVKILRADLPDNSDARLRFLHEARVTAALAHPAVVRVLDHDVEAGVPWLALEYMPGRSLRQYLKESEPSWPGAIQMVLDIARALEEAHGQAVLHRDIKPENVLEAAPGQWKVTDFGIAKWHTGDGVQTKTGVVMGTPTYISPEQVLGRPAGVRSDLYALGVLAFEALAGRPPFVDESLSALLDKHVRAPRPAPSEFRPELPPEVDEAVRRWIAVEPQDRPDGARAMAEECERLLALPQAAEARPERRRPQRVTGRAAAPAPQGTRPMGGSGRYPRRATGNTELIAAPPAGSRTALWAAALGGALLVFGAVIAGTRLGAGKPAPSPAASAIPTPAPEGPPPLTAEEVDRARSIHAEITTLLPVLGKLMQEHRGEIDARIGDFEAGSTLTEVLEGKSEFELIRDRLNNTGRMKNFTADALRLLDAGRRIGPIAFRPGLAPAHQVQIAWHLGYVVQYLTLSERSEDADRFSLEAARWPQAGWVQHFLRVRYLQSKSRFTLVRKGYAFHEKCVPVFAAWEKLIADGGGEPAVEARPGGPEMLAIFHAFRRFSLSEFLEPALRAKSDASVKRERELATALRERPGEVGSFSHELAKFAENDSNNWIEQMKAAQKDRQPSKSPR